MDASLLAAVQFFELLVELFYTGAAQLYFCFGGEVYEAGFSGIGREILMWLLP